MEQRPEIHSPGLYDIVAQLAALLRSDAGLRAIQTSNAIAPYRFDQPAGGITGAVVYTVTEAPTVKLSMLSITFDSTSGTGRYRLDGIPAAAGGVGIPIPAGAGVLNIVGANAIQNFNMIAETGQTLSFARYSYI